MTSIGLASRPARKPPTTNRYRPMLGLLGVASIGQQGQHPEESAEDVLAFAAQATDSTCKGCTANRAATSACAQRPGQAAQRHEQ